MRDVHACLSLAVIRDYLCIGDRLSASSAAAGAGARLRCITAVTPIRFTAYHPISFALMSLYDVLDMGVPRHSALLYAN